MVAAVGGRLEGDVGSEAILSVSNGDVSVFDVESGTIGVLYVLGNASNLEGVFVMGLSLIACDIMLCELIWFEQ